MKPLSVPPPLSAAIVATAALLHFGPGEGGALRVAMPAARAQDAAAPLPPEARAILREGDATGIPDGFREWVFLGAPLTPNGLNGGAAGFPEFHHVYIHPAALAAFRRTGVFPEGTTIVKELVLLKDGEYPDGSRDEASGRGYFADRFAGIDMMVKDSARFAETNGWGFFNFGHHAPPYAEVSVAAPNGECAFCHTANATTEMVFSTFYPILGTRRPSVIASPGAGAPRPRSRPPQEQP